MKVRDMIPRGTLIYHTGQVPSHITWYRFVLLVIENVNKHKTEIIMLMKIII